MKTWKWAGTMLLLVLAIACKERGKKEAAASRAHVFTPVTVPLTYTDPRQRAEYLAAHFWDHFDFTDTAFIHLPEVTEQAFAGYMKALTSVPRAKAAASVKKMLEEAGREGRVLHYFAGLYEKYLYDPNSPVMNEELYIPVLETIVGSGAFDEADQARAVHRLEMALKNRLGSRATDFSFTLASGKKMRLHDIKTEYTLLFFNNPGCQACKLYRDAMCASAMLARLIRENRLKVVAIYPDEDLAGWKEYRPLIPGEWLNGYDEALALREQKLYSLRAIPSLYLLDKEKTVLLKDAPFELVEQYLIAVTAPS
ncbi:MAG: DUF5106 domain-containing protein [Odoribacteraceae bacterium]|nr:DUF5106 domain-containing protein [Odoribacteraceae bacterium]